MSDRRHWVAGRAWCMGAVIASATVSARGDGITLRGGESYAGSIQAIGLAGVTIASYGSESTTVTVTWDRVRTVDAPSREADVARYAAFADDLWRARTRLERGDVALAAPLFETMFAMTVGQTHETALIVAQGMLRCRTAQGEQDLAVIPALETARLMRAGITTPAYEGLMPVMDRDTWLCPQVPPVWIDSPALVRLETALAGYDAGGDEVVRAIAAQYLKSVGTNTHGGDGAAPTGGGASDERVASGGGGASAEGVASGGDGASAEGAIGGTGKPEAGVGFLAAAVDAMGANSERRAKGRAELARSLRSGPEFLQGWSRYMMGVSLLMEGADQHETARMHLAHVPARFGATQPFLAAMAMHRLAGSLATAGQEDAARIIQNEMNQHYPVIGRRLGGGNWSSQTAGSSLGGEPAAGDGETGADTPEQAEPAASEPGTAEESPS